MPNDADDSGLISRVADVMAQDGMTLEEEGSDSVRASYGHFPFDRRRFGWIPAMNSFEVRREGIRGLRALRFDHLILWPVLESLFANGILVGWLSWLLGDSLPERMAILLPVFAFLGYFAWLRWHIGSFTRRLLFRAF